MDALPFFKIKEANARISELGVQLAAATENADVVAKRATELQAENARLKTELDAAKAATPANVAAAEAKATAAIAEVTTVKASLATAETKITELTAKLATFDETAINARIEKAASAKALEITQKQGQTGPVPTDPPANPKAEKKGQELTGLARAIAAHKAEQATPKV